MERDRAFGPRVARAAGGRLTLRCWKTVADDDRQARGVGVSCKSFGHHMRRCQTTMSAPQHASLELLQRRYRPPVPIRLHEVMRKPIFEIDADSVSLFEEFLPHPQT